MCSTGVSKSLTRSKRSLLHPLLLTTFAIVPLATFIILAVYGPPAVVSPTEGVVRDGVKEITIRAYTWGFSPQAIYVNPNDTVRFIVLSEDIKHGFAINELGINLQLLSERQIRSPAVRVNLPEGRYTIHCSIFCGMGHPSMKARLIVGNPGPAAGSELPWIASLVSLAAVAAFALFARSERWQSA